MKPFSKKCLSSYIKLINLFEKELKVYHNIFLSDYYYLNYTIQREQYTNDINIRIVMVMMRNPIWKDLQNEPDNLKMLLERFCRYFSVTDVSIVRHYLSFFSPRTRNLQNEYSVPKLEERINFEVFVKNREYRPI